MAGQGRRKHFPGEMFAKVGQGDAPQVGKIGRIEDGDLWSVTSGGDKSGGHADAVGNVNVRRVRDGDGGVESRSTGCQKSWRKLLTD